MTKTNGSSESTICLAFNLNYTSMAENMRASAGATGENVRRMHGQRQQQQVTSGTLEHLPFLWLEADVK